MSGEHVGRDLDMYLDRELDAGRTKAIDDHLGACSTCRRVLAEREAINRLVQAAPYYVASERLRARVLAHSRRSIAMRPALTWVAAAVVLVSVGLGTMAVRSDVTHGAAIADDAVSSHVRSLMANHLFDVQSADQHTVKPWFLGKLDYSPPVADLASIGFPLAGARLDYLDGRPVAALVYERQKHTINVFVFPDRGDVFVRPSARTVRGFHVRHWAHQGMTFWAVSDLNEVELTQFCQALEVP
jgi:anti-sigma factor RsiW